MGGGAEEEKRTDMTSGEEGKQLLKEFQPKKEAQDGPPPPPDGGWGWIIVAASFLCNMVLDGIGYSFGIFVKPLEAHFEGAGKGKISLVGSILAGFIMLVGPISSAMVNKFGPRLTCIAGACISAAAIFVSTFSPNVYMLMISYGIVGGLGLGLMYVPAVTAVGYWFEKKRSLVTGISTCGSGFGTIVFAPVVTQLLEVSNWQWTNRIIAGFCLLCTFLGLTMKPVPKPKCDSIDSITEMKQKNGPIIKNDKAFNASKEDMEFIDNNEETNKSPDMLPLHEVKTPTEPEKSENGYVTVLKNLPFFLVMLANLPAVMGLYIPYMYLPGITQQRGLSKSESALLISLIGFFNTGGRIVSGAVTDHPKVDALFMTFLALSWGAVCPFLMTFCYDFWSYTVVCIMFGVSLSAWPAVTSSMLVEMLELSLLTSAFGVLTCMRGAGAFLGPPLAGFVLDAAGPRTDMAANSTIVDDAATIDVEGSGLTDEMTTMEPPTKEDLAHYEIALYISTLLLGISALGHGFAFCVNKVQKRRKKQFNEA